MLSFLESSLGYHKFRRVQGKDQVDISRVAMDGCVKYISFAYTCHMHIYAYTTPYIFLIFADIRPFDRYLYKYRVLLCLLPMLDMPHIWVIYVQDTYMPFIFKNIQLAATLGTSYRKSLTGQGAAFFQEPGNLAHLLQPINKVLKYGRGKKVFSIPYHDNYCLGWWGTTHPSHYNTLKTPLNTTFNTV
jgi:hypothetical protein